MAFLEMIDIVKRFPGVLANDHVNLEVKRGEIHALMGENGAGKSTLMSILYGLHAPDEGHIRLGPSTLFLKSPLDAIASGIGMVHQAFKLFESLTVWENIVYRREPRRGLFFIDSARACALVQDLADRHGLPIDPRARVADLPVGVRQRLEILKALYRDANVLILDEPTAVLAPVEVAALFKVMRNLAAAGRTLLLVTHKVNEVMAVSDRITVLRDGRVTARLETANTDPATIVRAMTGREVTLPTSRSRRETGNILLDVAGLRVENGGHAAVDNASLQVRGGEIVGIAGVAGNGQSELIEAIMGLAPIAAGSVTLAGVDVTRESVAARRATGVSYIAEDRARTATAGNASAVDNLAMGFHRSPPLAVHGLLKLDAMRRWARSLIERFDIRISSEKTHVGTLSGGNLQKLVIARELAHQAPLLIAEQPTRGVDIGAIAFIHGELLNERERGRGILLVSAELSEILALADRILVMYEGRIVAEVAREQADVTTLGAYMTGAVAV
ncbi:MAG: ABC transporter ATP-binding protein [Gammaproteobacteria bacterium]